MPKETDVCLRCGGDLLTIGGLPFCARCNDREGDHYNCLSWTIKMNAFSTQSNRILITCPGATVYHPGANTVAAGVRLLDPDDPSQGYEIAERPIYGPAHVLHRWVKKKDAHLIRRCRSCQDYTIRMRRKEGSDLFIPPLTGPRSGNRRRP